MIIDLISLLLVVVAYLQLFTLDKVEMDTVTTKLKLRFVDKILVTGIFSSCFLCQ